MWYRRGTLIPTLIPTLPLTLTLFQLLQVSDKRLAVAWYFALKDTVVANDLDQASRIAYGPDKRFARVVTLEGALIEPSGTMSGGGGRPKVMIAHSPPPSLSPVQRG